MSRLLRLYPAAWRERYGTELQHLLLERPPTTRDQIDLARGAFDAWLHPQVRRTTAAPAAEAAPIRFSIAVPAIVGGLVLAASGLLMLATPVGLIGYKEIGIATPLLIGGMVLVSSAAIAIARLDRRGSRPTWAALTMLGGVLLVALPWPILIIGFFTHVIATIALGVALVARGRLPAGAALVLAGMLLPNMNTEDARALFLVPVGLLWIAAAVVLRRGVPTAAPAASVAPLVAD